MAKRQIIKNMLLFILWLAIGGGTVLLLVAAIQRKDAKKCMGVDITIKGVSNNFFVDKTDIMNTIVGICDGKPVGKPVGSFNLQAMERALQKDTWVKTAQLFFDNNERLQVNVLEREPVARVFTNKGTTFYLDTSAAMLPLSEKFSARLPVFTNFPSDKRVLLKSDSNLLKDILIISDAIQRDSFHMAMIDQVDITEQRSFEMIPKFGNTVIVFGDAKNADEKFAKLKLFYKDVVVKAGWNKYSEINLQYKSQVVAKRKGAEEVKADSLRTLQLMKVIAANAERMAADSLQVIVLDTDQNTTSSSIIQQSVEREENSSTNTVANPATVNAGPANPAPVTVTQPGLVPVNKPTVTTKQPAITTASGKTAKPVIQQKPVDTKKPKMVMPKPVSNKPPATKPTNEY